MELYFDERIPWYFNAEEIFEHPLSIKECYEPTFPAPILAYLCGVFNSFTLDYLLRFKVTAHVNMFYLYQLPVPRLTIDNPRYEAIATRVAQLVCVGTEIDGLVAHLYGLTEKEFVHVLDTFPQVRQSIKNAALDAYHQFALELDDLATTELIAKGETERVEFKIAACWNAVLNKKDDSMRDNIVQEVAAFLNSKEGGIVLIGVEDNGKIVGLSDDYKAANPQKQNRDGFQLFLLDTLKNNLADNWSQFYKISFGAIQGKDMCRIDILPATDPVYTKSGDFYIREGNRKRKLTPKETVEYLKQRWS